MPVRRKGFDVRTKEVVSPDPVEPNADGTPGEPVKFTISKASNAADIERANMYSKVTYKVESEDGTVSTEKDMPFGEIQVGTIKLCLIDWNIMLDEGRKAPISDSNIRDLISATERVYLYNQIIDFNPIWGGKEEVKNAS
jgi:hypothetical protein